MVGTLTPVSRETSPIIKFCMSKPLAPLVTRGCRVLLAT
jgi:hypothetical protein